MTEYVQYVLVYEYKSEHFTSAWFNSMEDLTKFIHSKYIWRSDMVSITPVVRTKDEVTND